MLRQNCQYSNGVRLLASSQTAPAAVLPIFWPAAVVISGVVRPNSWVPSIRRPSSTPLTMLPHWSEPPICSRQPVAARQLQEIVGLHHHVVELEQRQRLLALQPQLHRIEGEHAVDGEMRAEIAQERDVAELVQPLGVVDQQRAAGAEVEELGERPLDAALVGVDLRLGQQLPAFILARRVADLGRAATHQRDRPVAGLLQVAQHHDADQIADMQAVGGAVVADIGGDDAVGRQRVERRQIGALMDEAARLQRAQQLGPQAGHAIRLARSARQGHRPLGRLQALVEIGLADLARAPHGGR